MRATKDNSSYFECFLVECISSPVLVLGKPDVSYLALFCSRVEQMTLILIAIHAHDGSGCSSIVIIPLGIFSSIQRSVQ